MPRERWRRGLLGLGMAVGVVVAYRAAAAFLYRGGFPLDDAWIHQTYARNLAAGVGWVYRAGGVGRGAVTAPLWVLWLAGGHLLGLPPGWWVSLGGVAGLLALEALAWHWPGLRGSWRAWAAVLWLAEWHVVWAAVSGMETLAFTVAVWAGLWALVRPRPRWGWAGLAAGLALWLRPEGLLLGAVAVARALELRIAKEQGVSLWQSAGRYGLPVLVAVLAYGGFHAYWTGAWWPTTGPAKMVEYAALRQAPWPARVGRVLLPVLVGPAGPALLLGLAGWSASRLRIASEETVGQALTTSNAREPRPDASRGPLGLGYVGLWAGLHVGLYAWRLPVAYQHGRYVMPVLPAALLAGLWGAQRLLDALPSPAARRRVAFGLGSLAVGLTLGFLALGARAYAWDVAFIESEMVDTARWVAGHIPPEAVVAAHDIGALGYFAPQPLADLAGLLDPAVVPRLHDEAALAAYLQQQGARYLVTFPGWYTDLDRCSEPVFRTRAPFAPALGGENMVVYRWRPCPSP